MKESSQLYVIREQFLEQLEQLKQLQADLRVLINESFRKGQLWVIDAPEWVDRTTVVTKREFIHPRPIPGHEISTIAVDYLNMVLFQQDQIPTYSARAPGVLQVGGEAMAKAAEINNLKATIRKTVTEQVKSSSRRYFMREVVRLPNINLTYLYRAIQFLPAGSSLVQFRWQDQQHKVRKLTQEQAIQRIDHARVVLKDERWDNLVKVARERIWNTTGDIYQRAPQPPKPVARVRYDDGQGTAWDTLNGNIPILTDQALPAISGLESWIAPESNSLPRRESRSDRGHYVPLVPELDLYSGVTEKQLERESVE